MTVPSTVSRVIYVGNGATTAFPYAFRIFATSDLVVTQTDTDGASTTLALGTDYTVSGAGSYSGGTVTVTTAVPNGYTLTIRRVLPYTQLTDLRNAGQFFAETHEDVFDRQTFLAQQLAEEMGRSLKLPVQESSIGFLPPVAERASAFLGFDANGDPVASPTAPPEGSVTTAKLDDGAVTTAKIADDAITMAKLAEMAARTVIANDTAGTANPTAVPVDDLTVLADGSTTRRDLSARAADTINVKDFGAVGDGVADDTAAVDAAFLAAGSGDTVLFPAGSYLCGPIATVATSGVRVLGYGATLVNKPDSLTSAGFPLIQFSGSGVHVHGLTIDGNQANYSSGNSTQCLTISGSRASVVDVVVKNSPGRGITVVGDGHAFTRISAIDNAGLGVEVALASYHRWTDCIIDRNGYGFQQTRTNPADDSHGFAAFGIAIRFRSHHLTFVGCMFNDNGRDGFNVNQGSYAIKCVGCAALRNDDGGFTIASDNTLSGNPGEGEACYDCEFIGCEAANNYTSGLSAYQACHNITVDGGRYYNNHRVAGSLSEQTSFIAGVYFAAGSDNIKVRTKAYDERQIRPITASDGAGALTATGWVSGLKDQFPKVSIYSAAMAFLGYGVIASESSGSVTITSAANHGVTLATIPVGGYVSQAVQNVGVLMDNNCTAIISNPDGFGCRLGQLSLGGPVVSGSFDSGQNVIIADGVKGSEELLVNPTFDAGIASWGFSTPGGGSASHEVATNIRSPGGLRIIAGTSPAEGDGFLIANAADYAKQAFVEVSVWCYATAPGDGNLYVYQNNGGYKVTTVAHPGGGWALLRIGIFTGNGDFFARLVVAAGATVYFDSASARVVAPSDNGMTMSFPGRYLSV